jgi:hypothetical protein
MILSLEQAIDKPQGFVIYEGPSNLSNEDDIVVIATGFQRSRNRKTKGMIQIFIMPQSLRPIEAIEDGSDKSVCGDCFHRHARSCYVNPAHGPNHVYDAWIRGIYTTAGPSHLKHFEDKDIRLGAWGDPAAVPVAIWDSILFRAKSWTGYTHSYKKADPKLRQYCMASCDTEEEADKAKAMGWKPFLVREEGEELPKGYFTCPASDEGGKRLICSECGVCNGGDYREGQGMPSIISHGPSWKTTYHKRAAKARRQKKKWKSLNW